MFPGSVTEAIRASISSFEGRLDRIDQRDFVSHDQERVISRSAARCIAVKISEIPVNGSDPVYVLVYLDRLECFLHLRPEHLLFSFAKERIPVVPASRSAERLRHPLGRSLPLFDLVDVLGDYGHVVHFLVDDLVHFPLAE